MTMKQPPVRGAASLIVVLLLFLVLSLSAAYAGRNLIFEQKTSANQARSTIAFESAEAGIDWTLAALNGGRINNTCADSTAVGALSFQQRYLSIAANGVVSVNVRSGDLSPRIWPACVYNGSGWNCACPEAGQIDPAAPAGDAPAPAFRVWPAVQEPTLNAPPLASPWLPPAPGTVFPNVPVGGFPLTVAGCTRLPAGAGETCLDYQSRADIGEGVAGLRVTLVLRSGLTTPPSAAITARQQVVPANLGGAPRLAVVNTDQRSRGYTVNSGGAVDDTLFALQTIPGTPPERSTAAGDSKLLALENPAPPGSSVIGTELSSGDLMFVNTFGIRRQVYQNQPGLRTCPNPCSAATINALLADNPNRIIWVEGNLTLDANIGTAPAPVLLIVNGQTLTLGNNVQITGFVYLTGGGAATSNIALPDTVTAINGALVAEGGLTTTYTGVPAPTSVLTVTYDPAVLDLLRTTYGSWVRMAGSWRDYRWVQ
jgi:hypothetical protein